MNRALENQALAGLSFAHPVGSRLQAGGITAELMGMPPQGVGPVFQFVRDQIQSVDVAGAEFVRAGEHSEFVHGGRSGMRCNRDAAEVPHMQVLPRLRGAGLRRTPGRVSSKIHTSRVSLTM